MNNNEAKLNVLDELWIDDTHLDNSAKVFMMQNKILLMVLIILTKYANKITQKVRYAWGVYGSLLLMLNEFSI